MTDMTADTTTDEGAAAAGATDDAGQQGGRDERGRFVSSKATNGDASHTDDGDADTSADADRSPQSDWREALPEDLRKAAAKFTSPSDALKSYSELERKLSKAIFKPGDKASEEERADFRRKMGVPDTPEGYGVKVPDLPEGLPFDDDAKELLGKFTERMHATGAPPDVVRQAVDWYFETLVAGHEQRVADQKRDTEKAVEELENEWRDDMGANIVYARRLRQKFDPDNQFAKFLNEAEVGGIKLGDHPMITRFLATAGRALSEDSVHLAPDESEAAGINRQIDKLRERKERAMSTGNRQEAMRLDEEERQLYATLEGSAPLVGSRGRTA